MKKFKKIISAAIAAAVALTAFTCTAVSAAERVTGRQIKELAEITLRREPDLGTILSTQFVPYDGDVTNVSNFGELIDPNSAFLVHSSAEGYTRLIGNGADNIAEAIELCENGINSGTRYDDSSERCYYQPLPGYPNCADYPQFSGAAAYRLRLKNGEPIDLAVQPLYNYSGEYDKIAEVLNKFGIGKPAAVYLFGSSFGNPLKSAAFGISVSDDEEYIIPVGADLEDNYSDSALKAYELYDIKDYNAFFASRGDASDSLLKTAERERLDLLPGVRTRDELVKADELVGANETDSFSKYIGTEPHYSDITAGQAAVTNQLTDLGVINGSDGMFYPSSGVTRAETAAMLCRLFEIAPESSVSFADVSKSRWAAGYIGVLAQMGVLSGFGDGTFRPDESVTYEQAFKMVEQLLGYTPKVLLSVGSEYPAANVLAAVRLGLASDLGNFDSANAISRIELACVLSRALDTHMATVEVFIENLTSGTYYFTDVTLSDRKNGAALTGKLCVSDEELLDYTNALKNEYAEKTKYIIDETVRKVGGMGVIADGGMTLPAPPKNIPRITT